MTVAEVIGKLMDRTPPLHVHGMTGLTAMLQFNYHVMVAAGPLLDLAAETAHGPLLEGEPVLARYYARHAEEEREHAKWLKEDLAELDTDVLGPDHVAACIAGAQYYYLHHIGAVPFLGYLAAFELRPLKAHDLAAAKRMTGGRGLRTLAHHAEHDPHHARELSEMLERYGREELIVYNAMMTHSMYMEYAKQRIADALAAQSEMKEALWH